jgi:hypothetical protein
MFHLQFYLVAVVIHIQICSQICIYVCVYIYTHTHTHTHTSQYRYVGRAREIKNFGQQWLQRAGNLSACHSGQASQRFVSPELCRDLPTESVPRNLFTHFYIAVVFRKDALGYFVCIWESLFVICIATPQWNTRCDGWLTVEPTDKEVGCWVGCVLCNEWADRKWSIKLARYKRTLY